MTEQEEKEKTPEELMREEVDNNEDAQENIHEALKKAGVTKNIGDIRDQMSREYLRGFNLVSQRRQELRNRYRLYNNQRKNRETIGVPTLYTVMNALLARYYLNRLGVVFDGRFVGNDMEGEYLTNLATYDYDEMGLDIIDFLKEWDRLFFGVGVRAKVGWDDTTKTPEFECVDPLTTIPDPKGYADIAKYRFFGIEAQMVTDNMTEDKGFFNVDFVSGTASSEIELNDQARRQAQDLGDDIENSGEESTLYDVYNHYMIIDGKKYLTSWANGRSMLIRIEHIKPVLADELKDERKVMFPIVLNFLSPVRDTYFGVNIGDLVEDKQRALSIIENLRLSKEKAELYPMYLYDKSKVLNRADLSFAFNKFIAVDGDTSGAVSVMQKDFNKSTSFAVQDSLNSNIATSTGVGPNQAGSVNPEGRSASEIQLANVNADLRFLLSSKVNRWGEKRFWLLWYRTYYEFFSDLDEKPVRVNKGFLFRNQELLFKRPDFETLTPINVFIQSIGEIQQKVEKDRLMFNNVFPFILQDPEAPKVSINYAKRKLLLLNGASRDEVNIMIPQSPDEIEATSENILLSSDEVYIPINPNDDHLSHVLIHSGALDSITKKTHNQAHLEAYKKSGNPSPESMAGIMDDNVLKSQIATSMGANSNEQSKATTGLSSINLTG